MASSSRLASARSLLRLLGASTIQFRSLSSFQACRYSPWPHFTVQTLPPQVPRRTRTYAVAAQKGKLIFSESDVPPLQFWEGMVPRQKLEGVTGYECFEAAMTYCSLAAAGAGSAWKGKLGREYGIDCYLLHYIGATLLSSPPGPVWRLGLHVLATASDLDYSPSTLSLVMLLLKTNPERLSKTLKQQMFRDAQIRFRRIVNQGNDPDALTLNGLILATNGEHTSALRYFHKAIEAGKKLGVSSTVPPDQLDEEETTIGDPARKEDQSLTRRPFRWNWEASCYIGIGKVFLKQEKLADAEVAFRVAAEELDTADGFFELGKLQPLGSPARESYLTTGAVSGIKSACLELGELELARTRGLGSSANEADEHRKRSAEWMAIAGERERS